MRYVDPVREPNKWLQAVLLDLLNQNTEESKEALANAIKATVSLLEPGCIDQLFGPWIDAYIDLLDEEKNQNNKHSQQYSQVDRLGFGLQHESIASIDHLDTEGDTK